MKRLILAVLCAALMLSTVFCRAEVGAAKLTLLIYMCGSNLESEYAAATLDLREISAAVIPAGEVNVLIMTGGSRAWSNGIAADRLSVYTPERRGDKTRLKLVAAYESAGMGEGGTLASFLRYGRESCPAEKYALILWNHGSGPIMGVCRDELYNNDTLSLAELTAALSAVFADEPLEWIGFDACLMASAEVANAVSPYARYMIASEETEPGTGWDYGFLNGIADDESGADTGRRIIDMYFGAPSGRDSNRTLSCIDLGRFESVMSAVDGLFSLVEITGGNYASHAFDIRNTEGFGRAAVSSDDSDLIDLMDFTFRHSAQYPDETAALAAALESCVLYARSDSGTGGGLSVYHPFGNKLSYLSGWRDTYRGLGFSADYTDYTERFAEYLFGNTGLSWEGIAARNTDEAGVYALPLSEDQRNAAIDTVISLLEYDGGTNAYRRIFSSNMVISENGALYGEAGSRILTVSDGAELVAAGIPYTILADGRIGVYVDMTASHEEPKAIALPKRGPFDTYTVDQQGTETSLPSGSTVETVGTQYESLQSGSESYTVNLASYSKATLGEIEILQPVTEDSALSVSQAVVGSLGAVFGTSNERPPMETGFTVIPAPIESGSEEYSLNTAKISTVGSIEELKYLTGIDISGISDEELYIELDGAVTPGAETLSAMLVLESDGDGLVLSEIRVFDAYSGEMTTRSAADISAYGIWKIADEWKLPTAANGSINAFENWETVSSAETAFDTPQNPEFAFSESGMEKDRLCVMFTVTDIQNFSHSTVPMYIY